MQQAEAGFRTGFCTGRMQQDKSSRFRQQPADTKRGILGPSTYPPFVQQDFCTQCGSRKQLYRSFYNIMKKTVRVFVQSSQQYDDYADQVTTNATGEYLYAKNAHHISYTEKQEGGNLVCNTLILKKNSAELHRTGAVTSQMVFRKGETTDTDYLSQYGMINFKISTMRYHVVIDEDRINVLIQYDLHHNGQKVSRNLLQISIESRQPDE